MYGPSTLTLPASARRPRRPRRRPRGMLRLGPEQLGVARRGDLPALGFTPWTLRAALERGELRRIVHGWYALPTAHPAVVRALTAGFRLTCVDAARLHGLWIPEGAVSEPDVLHVHRAGKGGSLPALMKRHAPRDRSWPEPDAVASLPLALRHAVRCCDGETAAILLESAMERGLLTPSEVQQILDDSPHKCRSRIGPLSSASDSGTETRVVRWLRRRGFQVEQQVFVEGVGYVDAYVGGLFLEIDGRGHHSDEGAFGRDRRRDLRALRHGLQVLRVSYGQVWNHWERTQRDILAILDEVGDFGRRKAGQLALT